MRTRNAESGVILPMVIIFMIALTIVGLAILQATVLEHKLAMREVHRNQAFYLADGGIDHLLVKLRAGQHEPQIPWTNLGEGDYMVVGSYAATPPYAISTGRIMKGGQEILRKIKVVINKRSIYFYGVFGDEKVLLNGTPEVSSYYYGDPTWAIDEAEVGTNSSDPAAIELIGITTFINGDTSSGVGSDPDVAIEAGPGSISGDRAALAEHIYLPPVEVPEGLPEMGPLSVMGGATLSISADGKYSGVSIQGELTISSSGDLVFDSLVITGSGKIIIPVDVFVRIFVIGLPCKLAGHAVENTSENPAQFALYGAGDSIEMRLAGTTVFYGTIYAPEAEVKVTGTGKVYGALVGRRVELEGTARIYHDLSLGYSTEGPQIFGFTQWEELFG